MLQEVCVVADKLDRSVDFVGDACGELADTLEFLRLKELGLERTVRAPINWRPFNLIGKFLHQLQLPHAA